MLAGRPYVWGSIYRFEGQCRCLGRRPRRARHHAARPVPGGAAAGHRAVVREGGVLGVLCASIGSIMATEAIKLITGIGESLRAG